MLLAAPALLAFRSGDFQPFLREQLIAVALLLAVLLVLALTAPWPLVEPGLPLAALAALAGLAAWTWASTTWAGVFADAKHDAVRVTLYALLLAAALIVMRSPAVRRAAPPALLAGVTAVALYGLGQRLLPDLHDLAGDVLPGVVAYMPGAVGRFDAPLSYWNALGLLMAFGCLLSASVASDERHAAGRRALACAAAVPCGLALYLTLSRGGLLALGTGLVVLLLVRPRAQVLLAGAVGLGFAGLLVAASQALPAVRDLGRPEAERADQGLVLVLLLALAMAGARFLHARLAPRAARDLPLGRTATRATALALVGVILAVGAAVVLSAERVENVEASPGRLATLDTVRGDYWGVAASAFADSPLAGVGSGSFQLEWRRERDTDRFIFDAHSLYLETLAELGIVGGLLLAAFVATLALGLARRRRGDPLLAAAAPVLAAFAVHAGLEWDWEWPALVTPVLLLAAAALQPPEPAVTGERAAPAG